MANPKAIGLQAKSRFLKGFGARLGGIQSFDYYRSNESGGSDIELLTYYVLLKNPRIEPVLGIGGVYLLYYWNTGHSQCNLTDFNIGGGFGVNLRSSSDFRLGFSG